MFTQLLPTAIIHIITFLDNKDWDVDPDFQRDLVWSKKQKQAVINSIKRKMPFGMITITELYGQKLVIDGKQRTTTINDFIKNKFTDDEGKLFKDFTPTQQAEFKNTLIPVQIVTLEEGESKSDVLELFRRINISSKALTTGQLLWSCLEEKTIQYMMEVFINPTDNERITNIRDNWALCFCENDYNIGTGNDKSRGDITFLSALTISLLTGKNECITTSFSLLNEHGIKALNDFNITEEEEMKETFLNKLETFLNIALNGTTNEYFTRNKKGYPELGKTSILLYIINIYYSTDPEDKKDYCKAFVENNFNTFFNAIKNPENKDTWTERIRKNRNIKNLKDDFEFIIQHYR